MHECSVIKYLGPRQPAYYNNFFNPNICHVCKLPNDDITTISCDRCFMISYCSMRHRQFDELHHMEICAAITKFLTEAPQWDNRLLSMNEWIESKKLCIWSISMILRRELKPIEVQMIVFTKSCLICHQDTYLFTCTICYSVNYCDNHADVFLTAHYLSSFCKQMLLSLNLDIYNMTYRNIIPQKFYTFPANNIRIDNMEAFVNQYGNLKDRESSKWMLSEYHYSDFVSGPLTLLYGMWDLNLSFILNIQSPVCVIHIIAANSFDREYFLAWELLLHLNRDLEDLTIVLIGLDLYPERKYINLCSECSPRQKLFLESYNMLYHDYVQSNVYKRPNVIAGFQIDFDAGEIWWESLLALREQHCPLFLTAKSKFKADQNISKLQKVIGTRLSYLYHGKNTFCSCRPWRDIEPYVSYRNNYLTIYTFLK